MREQIVPPCVCFWFICLLIKCSRHPGKKKLMKFDRKIASVQFYQITLACEDQIWSPSIKLDLIMKCNTLRTKFDQIKSYFNKFDNLIFNFCRNVSNLIGILQTISRQLIHKIKWILIKFDSFNFPGYRYKFLKNCQNKYS